MLLDAKNMDHDALNRQVRECGDAADVMHGGKLRNCPEPAFPQSDQRKSRHKIL